MSAVAFEVRQAEPVDRNRERAIRFAQVTEQFATRLTLRPVRCRVADSGVAPAWSTSNTISFNGQTIGDLLDPRVVTASRGLALHEICHILFTPRSGTDLLQEVMNKRLGRAFNALEDQRIETLLVGRFGASIVDWFTYMVAQHLLESPKAVAYAFPLVRGRKYLPVEVRKAVRDAYVKQDDVQALSDIIDEYRTLLFPADTARGLELIEAYDKLVKQANDDGSGWSDVPDPNGHEHRQTGEQESGATSRPLSNKEQERARQNAKARNEQDEADFEPQAEDEDEFNFGDGDSDWDDADDESESESGAGDDSTDGEQSGEGDADSDAGQPADTDGASDSTSDSDSDSQQGDVPSDGIGTGTGEQSISDLLEDAIDGVLERLGDQIADDIAKYSGEVSLQGENVGKPQRANYRTDSVSPEAMRASKAFGIELERLRSEFEPAWERRVDAGRINAQRYLSGCDLDETFDQWSDGREDAVDIEAVILLDNSGSMSSQASVAYNSLWALKRALDKVNASCTVVTYSDSAKVLYEAEERATNTVKNAGVEGGTSPLKAIKYATKVLADSSRAVKVVFTITDGEWSNAEECDKAIKNLRDGGVLTALAYVSSGYAYDAPIGDKSHQCEIVSHIRSTADLFVLGRQLVKVATQRNLAH